MAFRGARMKKQDAQKDRPPVPDGKNGHREDKPEKRRWQIGGSRAMTPIRGFGDGGRDLKRS